MHLQVRIIPLCILLLLCVTILQGCRGTGRETDSRLKAIEEIINSAPAQAAARLDSIDPEMLSEPDRHLYTILNTSARDKLFLELESDSAILEAVRYYSDTPSSYRLAQSSYLAARVYHGLGDHPSAIRYYQKALDNIPTDSLTSYLRGCVLTQMATLVKELHIYKPAIHYLRESIRIDSIRGDSIGLAYDYQALAFVYRNEKVHLDSAQYLLDKAWKLSHLIPKIWQNTLRLDMANTLLMRNDTEGALTWLVGAVKDTKPIRSNRYLYTASKAFHQAGMLDSAYLYAKCLAFAEFESNKKTGFEILLSDNLYDRIPNDSLRIVVFGFRDALYSYLERTDGNQVALQTSVYNYSVHERDKEMAEKKADNYSIWIVILSCLGLIIFMTAVLIVVRSQKREIRYLKAKEKIRELETELEKLTRLQTPKDDVDSQIKEGVITNKYQDRFRKDLLELCRNAPDIKNVPEAIRKSESYEIIQELIIKEQGITDKGLWDNLRKDVEAAHPRLREHVELLATSKLTIRDWEIIWLIKFGVNATQLSVLLMRTKGSISSRRVQLGIKLFGEKLSAPFVDKAIRSL